MKNEEQQELENLQTQWNEAHDKGDMQTANPIAFKMQALRNRRGIKSPSTGDTYID